MISDSDGIQAVKAARAVTEAWTRDEEANPEMPESFHRTHSGVFVTLNEYPSGMLRACIGYPIPPYELSQTLVLAAKAVRDDPRFPRLKTEEAKNCTFDVTILTEPENIEYGSLDELKSKIRIGTDGLIVRMMHGDRLLTSGLFLPQVPVEQGWGMDEYLDNICIKAGLRPNAWKTVHLVFEKFQGECFGETEPNGEIRRKPTDES